MLPPTEVARFVASFAAFQARIGELVGRVMHTGGEALEPRGEIMGPHDAEWSAWLDESARPELVGLRAKIAQSLELLEREPPARVFADELRDVILELPEQVKLIEVSVAEGELSAASPNVDVPLRRWFQLGFANEVSPAFPELEVSLVSALEDISRRIEEVERVLDYYTLAAQRNAAAFETTYAEEFARTGLGRVQRLIDDLHRRRRAWARRSHAAFVERASSALEEAIAPYRAHQPLEIRRRLDEHERLLEKGPEKPVLLRRVVARSKRAYRALLPLSRKVTSELRTLFTEHESEALREKFRALISTDAAELGKDLPLGYRRLFAVGPIETADLYIARPGPERACKSAIEAWIGCIPQALLVHGERGAGKRALVNHVLARVRSQALLDVRWVRLGPDLRDEKSVSRVLARELGLSRDAQSFKDLTVVPTGRIRRKVVVVENSERLLDPSPHGVKRMIDFLGMVGETATSTLWVLLMATPAARLMLQRLGLKNRVTTIIHVEPMGMKELHAMISARHRLSGFELEFREPGLYLPDVLLHPMSSLKHRAPSDAFYTRLLRMSHGNPRQAMYYWLARAARHTQHDGRILVEPLPSSAVPLLAQLSLSQRLILALLAQHESLASSELTEALSASLESVEGDLKVLWAQHYVIPLKGGTRYWALGPTIAHPLSMELSSMNMI